MLNAWKDYLWPLVVLPNPEIQPLSVRLPIIRETVELDVFLAVLLISMALPIALFLVFQRLFLRGVSIGGGQGLVVHRRSHARVSPARFAPGCVLVLDVATAMPSSCVLASDESDSTIHARHFCGAPLLRAR